ncbi:MAG: restriction endonuclease [Oscillibacter sp.]|nr:restriction endonuclease [Oscillibacter sp.]MBQ9616757.1 restriction endonuclease [Oscillibacter sp.]
MTENNNNANIRLWAVHSLGDAFSVEQGTVAFDWPGMGDLSALNPDRDDFRKKFDSVYPDANTANRTAVAGALYRLVHEVRDGDYVACLHGETVSLGTVSGPYTFRDGLHVRPVQWLRHVQQSEFSRDAMREITCSPVRLFAVKRFAGEFLAPLGVTWVDPEPVKRPAVTLSDTETPAVSATASASTVPVSVPGRASTIPASASTVPVTAPGRASASTAPGRAVPVSACALRAVDYAGTDTAKFVLDTLRRTLTRETFRQFAAGLLRAMGYTISLPPDSGLGEYEMTARRDELFPPVLVQLRAGEVRDTDIARLRDALTPGNYGLVVTLSDFSERARQTLKQSPYLRAVDGPEVAALTLKYYCGLDERYRALIPLRMVYVPDQ